MFRMAMLTLALFITGTTFGNAGTTGVFDGYLRDSFTGLPLSGVTVTVLSAGDVEQTITDSKGYFVFLNLVPGTYKVVFQTLGYYASIQVYVAADRQVTRRVSMHNLAFIIEQRPNLLQLVRSGRIPDEYDSPALVLPFTLPGNLGFLSTVPGVQIGPAVRALP